MKIWEVKFRLQLGGQETTIMTELNALAQILAYVAKNRIKSALEADFQQRMAIKANQIKNNIKIEVGQNPTSDS